MVHVGMGTCMPWSMCRSENTSVELGLSFIPSVGILDTFPAAVINTVTKNQGRKGCVWLTDHSPSLKEARAEIQGRN